MTHVQQLIDLLKRAKNTPEGPGRFDLICRALEHAEAMQEAEPESVARAHTRQAVHLWREAESMNTAGGGDPTDLYRAALGELVEAQAAMMGVE